MARPYPFSLWLAQTYASREALSDRIRVLDQIGAFFPEGRRGDAPLRSYVATEPPGCGVTDDGQRMVALWLR